MVTKSRSLMVPRPAHLEGGPGQRAVRPAQRDFRLGDLDRPRGQRAAAFLQDVTQLVEAGLRRRAQVLLALVAHPEIVLARAFVGTHRHDCDEVTAADGARPAHFEGGPGQRAVRPAQRDVIFRLRFRLRLWRGSDGSPHSAECCAQLIGIARREVLPAGVLGDTGQGAGVLVAEAEAHHMRGKADPGPFERFRDSAGIAFAAF